MMLIIIFDGCEKVRGSEVDGTDSVEVLENIRKFSIGSRANDIFLYFLCF